MRLDQTEDSILIVTVSTYAKQHATTEYQVLKRIILGELSGYQTQGVWYIRLPIDAATQPIPTLPISVIEYSKQTGIPVYKILEEIANGIQPGFHKHGIWYVGTDTNVVPQKVQQYGIKWLVYSLLFASFIALILGVWIKNQAEEKFPKLASLMVNVKINDVTGVLKPVTQEKIYLLSSDLEDIADDYLKLLNYENNRYSINQVVNNTPQWVTMFTGSTALRSLLFDLSSTTNRINIWEFRQNFEKSKPLWKNYLVQQAITDKTGSTKFQSIPLREYWVVMWTETPTGIGFWKQWINLVQEKNTLSLVPSNAMYFK